jgi:hypothetical protein
VLFLRIVPALVMGPIAGWVADRLDRRWTLIVGDYVTDGEFNATLRKDDSVEAITLERAAELLAERRAKGPAKTATKKTAAKKKATAKKS